MSRDVQQAAGGLRITRHRDGAVTVLQLDGELDIESAPELRAAIARAFDAGPRAVVLNMAGVGFLDSTGVRMLLEARSLAGRELVLMAPSRAVIRVLDLTCLRGRFADIDADADLATLQR
jgi:anti-sigma B factor antagonist